MSTCVIQTSHVVRTEALRRALDGVRDWHAASDLIFLEQWLLEPAPGTAAALRIGQIKRANPELVAAISAEIARQRKPGPTMRGTGDRAVRPDGGMLPRP